MLYYHGIIILYIYIYIYKYIYVCINIYIYIIYIIWHMAKQRFDSTQKPLESMSMRLA